MRTSIYSVIAVCIAACVSSAQAEPFPAQFDLSQLRPINGGDGSQGTVIRGTPDNEFPGSRLSGAGDINADGIGDLLIGASGADIPGTFNVGKVYALFGNDSPSAQIELSALSAENGGDGSQGFIFIGEEFFQSVGHSVNSAGDQNNDSIDDIIIGAPSSSSITTTVKGQAVVVYGSTAGFDPTVQISDVVNNVDGLDDKGFAMIGRELGDTAGHSVSIVGDINGDGIADIVVGAPRGNQISANSQTGLAYVVFGRSGGFQSNFELSSLHAITGGNGSQGFVLVGEQISNGDRFGDKVTSIGDINGDGLNDIAVASPEAGSLQPRGAVYVIFGRTEGFPAELEMSSLREANGGDGSQGFFIQGVGSTEHTGYFISAAGDVNADGFDDVLIAGRAVIVSPDFQSEEYGARAYLVYGSGATFPPEISLSSFFTSSVDQNARGFVILGEQPEFKNPAGRGLSSTDNTTISGDFDINHDGIDDIIFGSKNEASTGRVFVLYGQTEDRSPIVDLTTLDPVNGGDGSEGFIISGIEQFDQLGYAVSGAGDFNGDGVDDMVFSAPVAQPDGVSFRGEVYVVYGRITDSDGDGIADSQDNCVLVSNPDQRDTNDDGFGNLCDADLNNDGIVNFLDLSLFRDAFLSSDPDADFLGDGVVNFLDFVVLTSSFLQAPGPGLGQTDF